MRMFRQGRLAPVALAGLMLAVSAAPSAEAQEAPVRQGPAYPPALPSGVKTSFVHLAQGVPGVLYEPVNPGTKAAIAVFAMHSAGDYLSFSACTQLAQRGYRVLCANNSTGKGGSFDEGSLERVLLDAKAAVTYLRSLPEVKHVVLMGHSGGATVMSAYQMIAEGGVATCQGAEKIFKCSDALAGLPKADGFMAVDANWGLSTMTLFSIDPAVTDEGHALKLDPALDLFNPANGFKPGGSTFPQAFVVRFQQAEGARNNRLIDTALKRMAVVKAGEGQFADDEPYFVPGASLLGWNNKLFAQDVRLMSHTKKPWPLIHPDGSITTQIVHTVRVPANNQSVTGSMVKGAMKTTLRNYLMTYAIRTTPDYGYDESGVRGIDWSSSWSNTPGNITGIHVPTLVMGMTANWEYLAAETLYERSPARDRSIFFVEGATHVYTPCKPCEKTPGQYGDTVKQVYDAIDRWLSGTGRFATAG
ncbi:alpha/beta hydrolase family protein [Novosphingobium terrae]|uniref:hypothetical protein n=1 Tax=Novosphingobium terrae TaxID=2726189 RepID=UPI001980DF6C|nr:hypothetical protein [Novosphingobium terrae]